jgi:dipeptidase D
MDEKINKILDLFTAINRIPRCSGNEKALSDWILRWAKDRRFTSQTDDAGNLLIRVPASTGFENAPTVVLQAHLDMVCEKTPGSNHDFSKDPIRMKIAGDWLMAEDTSLGADNGVAVAIGLALADDTDIVRPPLELLFTVEEETGLTGASRLDEQMVSGKILLNVDSEDEGIFTVGCAGGRDTTIRLPVKRTAHAKDSSVLEIAVTGLRGGHSGVDIAKFRGNANRLICRLLMNIMQNHPVRLISLHGGTARNAIARDARAVIAFDLSLLEELRVEAEKAGRILHQEYAALEKNLRISVAPPPDAEKFIRSLSPADTEKAVRLILAIPTGVAGMSPDFPRRAETSSNLAKIQMDENALRVQTSQRSNVMSRLEEITAQIESIAHIAGAEYKSNAGYPAWQPDMNAALLARCKEVYASLFHTEPGVEVIHAGLECAIIGSKYPEMDMISFGPTMKNPHSPDECLHLPSVGRIWQFIAALLASYRPPGGSE